MSVTFTADGTGSGSSIGTTGETVTLPNDVKVVEVYVDADGFYKKGAHNSSDSTWLPLNASSWSVIRGLNGTLGLRASTGTITAYIDTLSPIDVKQGR